MQGVQHIYLFAFMYLETEHHSSRIVQAVGNGRHIRFGLHSPTDNSVFFCKLVSK